MRCVTRRTFNLVQVRGLGAALLGMAGLSTTATAQDAVPARMVEEWMNEWMRQPVDAAMTPIGPLHLTRFADPIYVLTKSIAWKPNVDQQDEFEGVTVPKGFVTDFASVPRPFWSLLRPDGKYAYAAVVHDYLYWTQTRPRVVADEILRLGMQDFSVDTLTVWTIYGAVRTAGGLAWSQNAKLKSQGEKRILKRTPDDPTIRWGDWKILSDVFE